MKWGGTGVDLAARRKTMEKIPRYLTEKFLRGITVIEQLTLHLRATGSIPVRPTNYINDLGRSRPDPVSHKTCYRSVSGNRAAVFLCIKTAGLEFFNHTGN